MGVVFVWIRLLIINKHNGMMLPNFVSANQDSLTVQHVVSLYQVTPSCFLYTIKVSTLFPQ